MFCGGWFNSLSYHRRKVVKEIKARKAADPGVDVDLELHLHGIVGHGGARR